MNHDLIFFTFTLNHLYLTTITSEIEMNTRL